MQLFVMKIINQFNKYILSNFKGEIMKRKSVLTAKKEKVRIHDPIAALIARMCDPSDPIYDENVAKSQIEEQN